MSAQWFFADFPPSRSAIENALRLTFWKAGLTRMWFSCVKETAPFECRGEWGDVAFTMEWEPKDYLRLKMQAPSQELLNAFERVLRHKALAAYKNGDGRVVVEWRARNADARYQELQTSGVSNLERLDK
jgi:hypothetical protein